MPQSTPSDAELLDEAIDLVIRLQNDPVSPIAADLIRAWRARSSRHDQIWGRVAKAHGASGLILNEKKRIERQENLGLNRRNLLVGGLCLIGGGAGWMVAPEMIIAARADVVSEKAERRRINLPGGGVATLGPKSALAYNSSDGRRGVNLLDGMCFFETEAGGVPPLTVLCGRLQAEVGAAAFEVSAEGGVSRISSAHGVLRVTITNAPERTTLTVEGMQWLRLDESSGRVDRGVLKEGEVAIWRDNVLIADQEPVTALVERISRWTPGRIVIADPFIGSRRISGVFDLADPIRALEAVAFPAGAKVRRLSSLLTVVSPI